MIWSHPCFLLSSSIHSISMDNSKDEEKKKRLIRFLLVKQTDPNITMNKWIHVLHGCPKSENCNRRLKQKINIKTRHVLAAHYWRGVCTPSGSIVSSLPVLPAPSNFCQAGSPTPHHHTARSLVSRSWPPTLQYLKVYKQTTFNLEK